MICSLCRKEIEGEEIFNLIIENRIVTVCKDCWWEYLKTQTKGENNVSTF